MRLGIKRGQGARVKENVKTNRGQPSNRPDCRFPTEGCRGRHTGKFHHRSRTRQCTLGLPHKFRRAEGTPHSQEKPNLTRKSTFLARRLLGITKEAAGALSSKGRQRPGNNTGRIPDRRLRLVPSSNFRRRTHDDRNEKGAGQAD